MPLSQFALLLLRGDVESVQDADHQLDQRVRRPVRVSPSAVMDPLVIIPRMVLEITLYVHHLQETLLVDRISSFFIVTDHRQAQEKDNNHFQSHIFRRHSRRGGFRAL